MKRKEEQALCEVRLTMEDFLTSYNKNMPATFPRASVVLLKKFQVEYPSLFKTGDSWSLDQHRKKLMDWLPRNTIPL